jgi:3-oxoacyl-[acyl-carrier protein] reductase
MRSESSCTVEALDKPSNPSRQGLLDGVKLIITGASRGIGAAIAEACIREGGIVGVNYLSPQNTLSPLLNSWPDKAKLLPFDVRSPEQVEKGVREFIDFAGGVDCLVNNAGVFTPNFLIRSSRTEIEDQVDTNLLGPIFCSQAVLPFMLRRRSGVILNISSVATIRPTKGQAVYAAAKGGIEAFTRALASEYARKGIRVNCIQPGAIRTRMFLSAQEKHGESRVIDYLDQRIGEPSDLTDLVIYLLSSRSRFVNGSVFPIDGGYLVR